MAALKIYGGDVRHLFIMHFNFLISYFTFLINYYLYTSEKKVKN